MAIVKRPTIYTYHIHCQNEDMVYDVLTDEPTTQFECPSDCTHVIDSYTLMKEEPSHKFEIIEENIETAGRFQAKGFTIDVPASVGVHTLQFSWPHPVSLLDCEWATGSENVGDIISIYAEVGTIGTLTANALTGATTLDVSSTVLNNTMDYDTIVIDSGQASEEKMITSRNCPALQIDIDSGLSIDYTSGDSIKLRKYFISLSEIGQQGRVELGKGKIGGSYLPANVPVVLHYDNQDGVAKKFTVWVEYLF